MLTTRSGQRILLYELMLFKYVLPNSLHPYVVQLSQDPVMTFAYHKKGFRTHKADLNLHASNSQTVQVKATNFEDRAGHRTTPTLFTCTTTSASTFLVTNPTTTFFGTNKYMY